MKWRNRDYVLTFALLVSAFLLLLYHLPINRFTSLRVSAQSVFELSCPAGTSSVQLLQTFDQSTQKLRQNYCVDVNGNVFENNATINVVQINSPTPVQIGGMWFPGTLGGTALSPIGVPILADQRTTNPAGGTIASGNYWAVEVGRNKNGRTLASPVLAFTVIANNSLVTLQHGNNPGGGADFTPLTGTYEDEFYVSNVGVNGPFFLQTPWNRPLLGASVQRASNIVTVTTQANYNHGVVDLDTLLVSGCTDSTLNGTFRVDRGVKDFVGATQGTISYTQSGANSGPDATCAVFYVTAIDTTAHYFASGNTNGSTFSTFTFSGTQPPTVNTATIDPLQVAVNTARGDTTAAFGQGFIKGTVQAGSAFTLFNAVTPLTTPLILGNVTLKGYNDEYNAQSGEARGTLITSTWSDLNVGTVMIMNGSTTLEKMQVTATGESNAIWYGWGFANGYNGIFLRNVFAQTPSNAVTLSSPIRLDDVAIAFGWAWPNVTTAGGRYGLFAGRSSTAQYTWSGGRINGGATGGLGAGIATRTGANIPALDLGGASGAVPAVNLTLDNVTTESTTGINFDFTGGNLILTNNSTTSDATPAVGTEAITKYTSEFWGNAGQNAGIQIENRSILQGNVNYGAGVKFVNLGTAYGSLIADPNFSVGNGASNVAIDLGGSQHIINIIGSNAAINIGCDIGGTVIGSAGKIINPPGSGTALMPLCLGGGDYAGNGLFTQNVIPGGLMLEYPDYSKGIQRRFLWNQGSGSNNLFEYTGDPGTAANLAYQWGATVGGGSRHTWFENDGVTPLFFLDDLTGQHKVELCNPPTSNNNTFAVGCANFRWGFNGAGNFFSFIGTPTGNVQITPCSLTASCTMTGTVASGTATMTTAAIASQACGTVVTVAAAGTLTTDSIAANDNAQPAAATNGVLIIKKWPTAGNVNFFYCNPTAASVTPAAATLNWRVTR